MNIFRIYETRFPGDQAEPRGFWGNDFGGNMQYPVLKDYKVAGFQGTELWLDSKTGDSSDVIRINFVVDPYTFASTLEGKTATFKGELKYDRGGYYYSWTCTKVS